MSLGGVRLRHPGPYLRRPGLPLYLRGDLFSAGNPKTEANVGILWIILIIVLVLALLGFFSRGYW